MYAKNRDRGEAVADILLVNAPVRIVVGGMSEKPNWQQQPYVTTPSSCAFNAENRCVILQHELRTIRGGHKKELGVLRQRVDELAGGRKDARKRRQALEATNTELEQKNSELVTKNAYLAQKNKKLRSLRESTTKPSSSSQRSPTCHAARRILQSALKKYHPDKSSGPLDRTEVTSELTALLAIINSESG